MPGPLKGNGDAAAVFLLGAVFVKYPARPMRDSGLPIDDVLPQLRAALGSHRSVVLQAPPGAGKSTVVPLALLDEAWRAASA